MIPPLPERLGTDLLEDLKSKKKTKQPNKHESQTNKHKPKINQNTTNKQTQTTNIDEILKKLEIFLSENKTLYHYLIHVWGYWMYILGSKAFEGNTLLNK